MPDNNLWPAEREPCKHAPVRKADITVDLVSKLVRTQFPEWAQLPVRPVDVDGWDNATFRLGETMSVRLPSAGHYVEAVEKENRWLPILASELPLPVPHRDAGSRGRGRYTDGSTAHPPPRRPSQTCPSLPPTWPISSPPCTRSMRSGARRRARTTSSAAAR